MAMIKDNEFMGNFTLTPNGEASYENDVNQFAVACGDDSSKDHSPRYMFVTCLASESVGQMQQNKDRITESSVNNLFIRAVLFPIVFTGRPHNKTFFLPFILLLKCDFSVTLIPVLTVH